MEALEEIKNFLKSWKSRAFLERFSEPRKIRPKKKSVLFSRGLESGCRNFCSFRRPFLLEFFCVDNFFLMVIDVFPQSVTVGGSVGFFRAFCLRSLVRSRLRRSPGVIRLGLAVLHDLRSCYCVCGSSVAFLRLLYH